MESIFDTPKTVQVFIDGQKHRSVEIYGVCKITSFRVCDWDPHAKEHAHIFWGQNGNRVGCVSWDLNWRIA